MAKSNRQVKLAICGALGRMGARITALAENDARFEVVSKVDRSDNLAEVFPLVDVVIDFTAAESTAGIAAKAAQAKKALVIGTTGLSADTRKKLQTFSRKIPIVFSPNMSVGVNTLFKLVQAAAETLAHYDIEIVEAHHNQKKDSPSGTAMKLAEIAAEFSGRLSKDFVYGRKGLVGARAKKEIGISAVRAGDIVGDHTVMLAGPGERLELTHRAHSRDAFAAGALQAAYWAVKQKPGFYSMRNVLKI